MHSGGLELTKLTYIRLEDNLIRHRGDQVSGVRYPALHVTPGAVIGAVIYDSLLLGIDDKRHSGVCSYQTSQQRRYRLYLVGCFWCGIIPTPLDTS